MCTMRECVLCLHCLCMWQCVYVWMSVSVLMPFCAVLDWIIIKIYYIFLLGALHILHSTYYICIILLRLFVPVLRLHHRYWFKIDPRTRNFDVDGSAVEWTMPRRAILCTYFAIHILCVCVWPGHATDFVMHSMLQLYFILSFCIHLNSQRWRGLPPEKHSGQRWFYVIISFPFRSVDVDAWMSIVKYLQFCVFCAIRQFRQNERLYKRVSVNRISNLKLIHLSSLPPKDFPFTCLCQKWLWLCVCAVQCAQGLRIYVFFLWRITQRMNFAQWKWKM